MDDLKTDGIRFLGDLQKLMVEPGDVFVLSCERSVSEEEARRLREILAIPLKGATVIVLDGGVKLEAVNMPQANYG